MAYSLTFDSIKLMRAISTFILIFISFHLEASPLCVTSDIAILRKGPGSQFAQTWTVGKYMPFLEVDIKGGWMKVKDLDGQTHWVHQNQVSKKMKCVVVKVPKASLRTGPGVKFSLAAYQNADKYFPFKLINQKEDWYQTTDASGNKFWLHESTLWRPRKISTISF
jgi:SH3-like domain-containing protein